MNDIIFSRYIGHDDILMGEQLKDCSECWICKKWSKQRIVFHPEDEEIMKNGVE